MRTTKLLATLLVAALAVVACKQDEDYVLPSITLSTPTLDFSTGTDQTIDLLATRDWQILGKPEWVQQIEPDHGPGTNSLQRIRLIVNPNEGYNREDQIVFTIGLSKATLAISQPGAKGEVPVGTGTKDDPYTVKGVLRYIETLGADVESPQDVYIKGKISEITEAYSAQYGNASFKIKDDGGEVFTVYRALYLGNKKWTANDTQIKADDEVVICGRVINFKGNTPETQQNKAYLYSLNGVTEGNGGSGTTTEVKIVTVAEFNAAEPSTTQKYQLTGKVTGNVNSTYGNFDLEDATGTVYVYGLTKTDLGYGTKNDQSFASLGIKAGDTVTIIGYRATYKQEGKDDKIEVVNAYYVSHTAGSGDSGSGGQGSGAVASGDGSLASPYNPAGAVAVASALASGAKTESKVYVKGKISSIKYTFSAQFGTATFDISEDGTTNGTQFTCYSIYYFNDAPWQEGNKQIEVGNDVVVYGLLVNYNGNTPETSSKEACLYSLNGQTE